MSYMKFGLKNIKSYIFSGLLSKTPKQNFLHKLRGKGKRYKRYLGSPLRYACGKSWAVGYVFERLQDNIKRLVSPFFSGGSTGCVKMFFETTIWGII